MKKQNKTDGLFYLKYIPDHALQFLINQQSSNQLKHPQPKIDVYYYKGGKSGI
ncbi:MAG: hypothetical protein K8R67_11805 [Desulfobacteraceae bacterium]|nr:hypothetical protein [Desulfobacteraceae bacterium]